MPRTRTGAEKKTAYRKPLYQMIDHVLEVGRNEHGLFFDNIDPITGKPLTKEFANTDENCPECNSPMVLQEGCMHCPSCGYAKCGA